MGFWKFFTFESMRKREERIRIEEEKKNEEELNAYYDKMINFVNSSFPLVKSSHYFKNNRLKTSSFEISFHRGYYSKTDDTVEITYFHNGDEDRKQTVYFCKDGKLEYFYKDKGWMDRYSKFVNWTIEAREKNWQLYEKFLNWSMLATGSSEEFKQSCIDHKNVIEEDPRKDLERTITFFTAISEHIIKAQSIGYTYDQDALTVEKDQFNNIKIKWYGNTVFDTATTYDKTMNYIINSDPSWYKYFNDVVDASRKYISTRKRHDRELEIIKKLHRKLPRNYIDDKFKIDYEFDYIYDEEERKTRNYLRYIVVYDLKNGGKCVFYYDTVHPNRNLVIYGDWIDDLADTLNKLPRADYFLYGNEEYQEYKRRIGKYRP